jgi:alpha-galactosidase
MNEADVPADAPNDAVMASPAEIAELSDWAVAAFAGERPPGPRPRAELEVRRQDHNVLRFAQSCMETPIKIGKQTFQHGLGTHANSEIVVTLPAGAKTFNACVGVDNNPDTGGVRGTVEFIVEANGKELLHTPTLKGGGEPVPVSLGIPKGATQLTLKVDATPDGTACDQADWADAQLVLEDGAVLWLDENQPDLLFLRAEPPFSFIYAGAPSAQFLKTWPRASETKDLKDRVEHHVAWTDPKTGLRVSAVAGAFKRYPAVEWVLYFENQGKQDTPILEGIQALDLELRTGISARPAVLHQLAGDSCSDRSFVPFDTNLEAGKSLRVAPSGGRSSNGAFPFFNLEYGGQGVIAAIGWSGQWAASFDRAPGGPTRLRAGMEKSHLVLHPGERIRSPRILLLHWKGDRIAAHNRFRRLMLFHYVPKQNGRPAAMPIFWQGFDRYSGRPGWATEAGQLNALKVAHEVGCDTLWLDAAWFPGGFPNGVGNWSCDPQRFPNGLKPVSDAAHKLGMGFILWFEPERVAAGTEIAREHPEFVFGGANGGLFKLNDPAARRWLTGLLSKRMEEFGLDWYRNDFNIDPLGFWRANDAPDRQGMTEIRYVEGHYEMWDELRARKPGLLIDNCASGGRRIDLETCMRSVPLWQSDTSCSPGHPEWNQTQNYGLSHYLPFHDACIWTPGAYDFRSGATAGAITQFAFLDPGFSVEAAKAAVAEAKENQKYWYGDFYPLTPCSPALDQLVAWQFHRPDLNAGLILAFRRPQSPYLGLGVALHGLNPAAPYAVEFIDDARNRTAKTLPGRQLAAELELRLEKKGSSLVVRYREAMASPR